MTDVKQEPIQEPITEQGSTIPRWLLKLMTRVNVVVYRASKGRLMSALQGMPICLVTMTGAKSGKKRTIPLMYVPYKDGVLLVASQGGAPRNPVWYNNLVAHPNITIEQGGELRALKAVLLDRAAKEEAWPVCTQYYPPYDEYKLRTARDIPVFYCGP